MDRLGARLLRHLDDPVHLEIALGGRPGAEQVGLVRAADVRRLAVGLRVDGHAGHAELLERAHDPDGDLAPVGDQDLGEHGARRLSTGG
jgi:hypothetical protein